MTAATLLDVTSVPEYLRTRTDLTDVIDAGTVTVREVGDGNLNLVFVATDAVGCSLVIKQSLPYVRMVGESWPLSQDRILAEARGYEAATAYAPGATPDYYGLDRDRRLIVLEDLSSWTVWRTALNAGLVHPGAAAALGRYVARVAFGTSVFGLAPDRVKQATAAAINPELCRITEDLVFTEPYRDHEHNVWDAELTPAVLSLRDGALVDHVAQLKYRFLTSAQALVHGDLHTGSVFVPPTPESGTAKAFDLEFSYYGPVGFDLGALFGNYLAAQARAAVLGRPAEFRDWLAGLAEETWDAFESQIRALWPDRVDDSLTDAFLDAWLRGVWADAVGFGGLKAIRRVVGMAKVSDLQSLEVADRVLAASGVLRAARAWIERREEVAGPADLAALTAERLAARTAEELGASLGRAGR